MKDFFKKVYSEIAARYELVNHIFSLGLDIFWRKRLARVVVRDGATRVLDLCTGTGETARCIRRLSRGKVSIVGADFSPEMLNEARKHSGEGIEFELADALKLPFADGSFDAVTMSFAARNLNSGEAPLVEYFREINRVIKNGGAFYNLETSRPSNSFIRAMFRAYVGLLVAIIGKKFSGNDEGYKYLAGSILEFMGPDELSRRLKDAGFSQVSYTKILTGAVAIHKAVK